MYSSILINNSFFGWVERVIEREEQDRNTVYDYQAVGKALPVKGLQVDGRARFGRGHGDLPPLWAAVGARCVELAAYHYLRAFVVCRQTRLSEFKLVVLNRLCQHWMLYLRSKLLQVRNDRQHIHNQQPSHRANQPQYTAYLRIEYSNHSWHEQTYEVHAVE
jgi:hypothetical protein